MIAGESKFSLSGGTIQKCHAASGNGGGISFSDGTLTIQGAPVIAGNTKEKDGIVETDNLYLPEGRQFTLAGTMSEGASVGISISPAAFVTWDVPITTKGYINDSDIVKYFIADQDNTVIELDAANQCLNIVLQPEETLSEDDAALENKEETV